MKILSQKRDLAKWDGTVEQFKDGTTVVLQGTDKIAATDEQTTAISSELKKETDANFIKNGLTYYYGDAANNTKVSLKELDKGEYYNPNESNADTTSPDAYSEVMSVQAGGELVYVSNDNVSFTVVPNQTMSFKSAEGDTYDIVGGKTYNVVVDSTVTRPAPNNSAATEIKVDNTAGSETITVKNLESLYKYLGKHIDTNSFKPKTTGLYIFKRNTNMTDSTDSAAITEDCEFSGYYYVEKTPTSPATEDAGGEGKYFALQYVNNEQETTNNKQRSEYVLPDGSYTYEEDSTTKGKYTFAPGATLALYTAKQNVVENSALTWVYKDKGNVANGTEIEDNGVVYKYDGANWKKPDGTPLDSTADANLIAKLGNSSKVATLTATYYGAENATVRSGVTANTVVNDDGVDAAINTANTNTSDDIAIEVKLNNIGTDAEKWTAISKTPLKIDPRTFYYNNDVEEGATTSKLVDSIELSQNTKKEAYLAFDFDLNVFMDSVQVTINDDGKEAFESVTPWKANADGAQGTAVPAAGAHTASSPTQSGSEIENIVWTYDATT